MQFMALHGEREATEDETNVRETAEEATVSKVENGAAEDECENGGEKGSESLAVDVVDDNDAELQDDGKWTITKLMLLQHMAKNGHFWAYERVQIMDCSVTEAEWTNTGAQVKSLKIV